MTDPELPAAAARVRAAALEAGIDAAAAGREAAALAAGVLPGRAEDAARWSAIFDQPADKWPAAAAQGRAWRSHRTPLLDDLVGRRHPGASAYGRALAGVAASACELVEQPTLDEINAAGFAARAQLVDLPATPAVVPDTPSPAAATTPAAAVPSAGGADIADVPEQTLDELLAQLDGMVGLAAAKEVVHRKAALLRLRALRLAAGLKVAEVSHHLVFVGNPGTGKTSVARLVGQIYRSLGVVPHGQLVETDRSGLVAGYEGQSALKADGVIKTAIGGVLFIDEAYALASDEFGMEVIATLLKAMEDHRDELVVIVAGYPEEMAAFIDSNPGFRSRFPTTVRFDDYTDDEMVEMFCHLCTSEDYAAPPSTVERVRQLLGCTARGRGFGNGRWVRNLYESAVEHQAWRMRAVESPTVGQLRELEPDDVIQPG